MIPHVVVDVGNTRIKWGRCSPDSVVETASLPPNEPSAWIEQLVRWRIPSRSIWILSGVQPQWCEQLTEWLRQRGEQVRVVKPEEVPLRTRLLHTTRPGIDRLLDAVAANRRRTPGRAAVIVDAGSAVTVDYVDSSGAFAGGAILPGFQLMAKALNEYTALLPRIKPPASLPAVPGTTTIGAIEAGIFWSMAGGVEALLREYHLSLRDGDRIFLTGGDALLLQLALPDALLWPQMTLEGLRLTAETLS